MICKTDSTWKPVLASDLANSAREFIGAIAADVDGMAPSSFAPSLLCEKALLFAYLTQVDASGVWKGRAIECLNLAIEQISDAPYASPIGLHGGLAGIGWMIQHVSEILAPDKVSYGQDMLQFDDDSISAIDQLMIHHLERDPWTGDYDLVSGLVGMGVYCLERVPRAISIRALELIVNHLSTMAEAWPTGMTWFTPPERLPEWQLKLCPSGYYNLGAAHGIPGVVQFMGEVAAAGIMKVPAEHLLEESVRWLTARQRSPHDLYRYSSWFVPGVDSGDSRLGWCYGDLGIGAILHHTARAASRPDWGKMATEMLDRCMLWPLDRADIRDPGLCHGAAGIAHIFSRIYQTTGDTEYQQSANAWLERGLAMRQPNAGVGGFLAWGVESDPRKDPYFYPDASFLSGAIGTALALLSAVYPIEPEWDRLLLLSGRGCGSTNPMPEFSARHE